MKILLRTALSLIVLSTAACTSPSAPTAESTPEVIQEATAEVVPSSAVTNPAWVTVTRTDPQFPGWELQYPEGWDRVSLDDRTIFLFSTAGAGDRLLVSGLQPGELAFQFSLNPVANTDETIESHLSVLSGTLRDFTFGDATAFSAAGLSGVQQTGVNERLGLKVLATSRQFLPGQFVDVFAFSRADEFDASTALMNAVIETARYTLATE